MVGRVQGTRRENDGPKRPSFSQCVEWHGASAERAANILREAVRLIRRSGWSQKHPALDVLGLPVHPTNPDAISFQAGSAMVCACNALGYTWFDGLAAEAILLETIGKSSIHHWNEDRERTADEVECAFYRALYRAEQLIHGVAA